MKKTYLTFIGIMLLSITACSSQPMWRKVGVSPFDIQNTLAKCRYDIGLAKISSQEKHEMTRDCMVSQGYRYN